MTDYLSEDIVEDLIHYVDDINLEHGATTVITDPTTEKVKEIERRALGVGLKLLRAKVRHLGTEVNLGVLKNIYEELKTKVDYAFCKKVKDVIVENGEVCGVVLADNEDKIYRMGCVAAIKARNIDFNRTTGELNISPYERKVLKLAAVCKDYDSDNREYSDKLVFEADFDPAKNYNDFEVQIYWQNPLLNISPTRDLTYEPRAELMGALKDVVLSVNKKFVEK